jgi:hypothetical protein
MKNYLVCAVRPIQNGWMDNIHSTNLYKDYQEMYNLRLASYQKFVKEPFESILWEEPALDCDNYNMVNWYAIKELWHRESCNIFWAGADTLMIRPTSLFSERWTQYRLFNYTDPRNYQNFTRYFNDDVQYYPSTMTAEIWQLGEDYLKLRETAVNRNWGFDQNRHNAMFWSQAIDDSDRLHPGMNWMAMNMRSLDSDVIKWHEQWNQLKFDQAHILHFCASRGSQQVINIMKELCKKLEIPV